MRLAVGLRAFIFHYDQLRFLGRACGYRQQGAHFQARHLFLTENLYRESAVLLTQGDGLAGKVAWCADIAGQIAQVAGTIDAGTDGGATVQGDFQSLPTSRLSTADANQLGADGLALLALGLIVFVAFTLCFLGESLT